MRAAAAALLAVACIAAAGCGGSTDGSSPQLTPEEEKVWAPLPPDRSQIPVLLYHGIGPESEFSDAGDAAYGVGTEEFAKQMTLIEHAGYETVDLQTFIDFVEKKPVDLPPRPLLLTFDDARSDSYTGADDILNELGFSAVMFVDVGRVEDRNPEYLTWPELESVQDTGRWQLQLHSGEGHQRIRYGPGENDTGPYYAYEKEGEDLGGWRERAEGDITWGQDTLAGRIAAYRPLAFSPPYGSYGQDGTNDKRIPGELLGWLTQRYDAVFTQDVNALARPGNTQPLGRIQVTRATTGGQLHDLLLSGGP